MLEFENGSVSMWVKQLLPVLRLLRVLSVNSPSRQVLQGTAEFLHNNIKSVIFVLRLRLKAPTNATDGTANSAKWTKSLSGLALAESLTSLLATIASASPAPHRRVSSSAVNQGNSTGSSNESSNLWDSALGSEGNSILDDLCDLLRLIGGDPFPIELAKICGVPVKGDYWTHIEPSSQSTGWIEDEEYLAKTIVYNDDEFREFPKKWTAFDHVKLDVSLKIVSNISLLLRLRAHAVIEHGFANSSSVLSNQIKSTANGGDVSAGIDPSATSAATLLSSFDFNSIAQAFFVCSSLSRTCVGPSQNLRGTIMKDVQATLLYISENLITTLHDLAMAGSAFDTDVLNVVVNEAGKRDRDQNDIKRQFINEIARVIRDKFISI